jgi:hypothetical protein
MQTTERLKEVYRSTGEAALAITPCLSDRLC